MNKKKFFMTGAGILLMLVIFCVAGASIGGNGISGQIREEDKELIPDIPNDAYYSTENGWETYCSDYVKDGSNVSNAVGYAIYHMPDASTGDVLNYVMRYEAETNIYWDAQQFYNTYRVILRSLAITESIFIDQEVRCVPLPARNWTRHY